MSKKHKRKSRSPGKPLWYKLDPSDPMQLILRNGTRIRKGDPEVELYISQGKRVYGITKFGLHEKRVDYCKKNNYCKKIMTGRGHHQGETYPRVTFCGKKYSLHHLMAKAWKGGIPNGFVADHTNGDINDFSYKNIRVIDKPENSRCGGILKRLRNVAIKRNDPGLNPLFIAQKDLIEIFERTRGVKGRRLTKQFLQEVERYRVLVSLRHAAAQLRDPSINPDNMSPLRRNKILSAYRVDAAVKVIDRLSSSKKSTKKLNFNKKTLWNII